MRRDSPQAGGAAWSDKHSHPHLRRHLVSFFFWVFFFYTFKWFYLEVLQNTVKHKKHNHLQTRQSITLCSGDPPFAFETQDEPTEAPLTKVFLHMDSEGLVQQPVFVDHCNVDKITHWNIKTHDLSKKIKNKKSRLATNFQKYDYYIFQLKCQRTEGRGRRQGRQQGWAMADPAPSPPILEMPFVAESRDWPVLKELLGGLQVGPTERGRRCCATGLLLDTPRTTDKRHSVRCSPPQSTRTDWPTSVVLRVLCLRTEGKSFGVTVIFTLILFTEGRKINCISSS